MRKTVFRAFTIAVVLSPAVVLTQSGQAKPTTATYISKEEIDIVSSKGQGIDRTIKVVDLGHENFAIGLIQRGPMAGGVAIPAAGAAANPAPAAAAAAPAAPAEPCGRQMATVPPDAAPGGVTHDSQTEGYYILSGGGTMYTGGDIVNGRRTLSPELNGPSCVGAAYGVVRKVVKAGDIVIIPAGVVHGWLEIADHTNYFSFRPSPNILKAGYVHPTIR